MKILKKLIKKENGSITMTVLAAMLFITTVLVVSYFSISSQGSNQNRKVQQISKQYGVTDGELEERYNQLLRQLDNTSYMKINEIKSLGNIMLSKKTNTETVDADGNRLVIPGGFKLKNEENTDKVESGLVIEDKDENQWVWIPVSSSDLTKMYTEDSTGWTMLGTSVNTKLRTMELTEENTYKLGGIELPRTVPGNYLDPYYREPDLLSREDTDPIEDNYTIAGFKSLEDMATNLKNDYKDMINSIKTNGGFYVGRYELGKDLSGNPQVKAGTVMSNANWYNLYSACKSFSNEKVESRMIWGCQWDQICRFINEQGDKVDLDDSRAYGNYTDSTGEAATNSGESNYNITTGRNSAWKTNNIFDLAGNCSEWTQEAYQRISRGVRGRK